MSPRRAAKRAVKAVADRPQPGDLLINDPILKTISRAAFALVMLFALLLLWRGHNAPGGGFIAGLMTVGALILHRIANGDSALRLDPVKFIPWGLALSLTTGLVPYLLGRSFLKSDYGYITTALTGEFEWATALLFDLGVYLVVVGAGLSLAYALIEVEPTELVEGDR
ncbi:MnhB domain-containing protein [Deinococcus frigens]|uniref:MnhB domain-containing protein n=1 Tax=Deinococcus frigens TaxID=249403 RepID=UPI00054D198C|nr:MnhB domain-containing protein [Deinococcus frigens]